MSQSVITLAFEAYQAEEARSGNAVKLDEFVLAYVPNLDPTQPIDRAETIPPDEQIVYRQPVDSNGVINHNTVTYSITMGTNVGDFEFNWLGLINKKTGLLAMIGHAPTQQKIATVGDQQGNALTRSFLMEYAGAAAATGITTPAQTWQIDFTARLNCMDESRRLAALDVYGAGAFFDSGFLVTGSGNSFSIKAGTGYVGGLRVELERDHALTLGTKPAKVWVDASWTGTVTSRWQVNVEFKAASEVVDYVDAAGVPHYVFAIAAVDSAGVVTDLRPKGSTAEQDFLKRLADHEKNSNVHKISAVEGLQNALDSKLDKSGGTLTGSLTVRAPQPTTVIGDTDNNAAIYQGATNVGGNSNGLDTTKVFIPLTSQRAQHVGGYMTHVVTGLIKQAGNGWGEGVSGFFVGTGGSDGGPSEYFTMAYGGKIKHSKGHEFYSTAFKPSAADVGALPLTGGTLTGRLTVETSSASIVLKPPVNKANFILSQNTSNENLWYLGVGSDNSNDVYFSSYKNNTALSLRSDGVYASKNYYVGNYKVYHQGHKPSAADVGALPISGGSISGPLITSSAGKTAVLADVEDLAAIKQVAVNVGGSSSGTDATAVFVPLTAQCVPHVGGYYTHVVTGTVKQAGNGWGDGVSGFFVGVGGSDGGATEYFTLAYGGKIKHSKGHEFYSTAFKPGAADVGAYSKSECDAKFISGIRLGTVTSIKFWGGSGFAERAGYMITSIINSNSDDLVDTGGARPLQYQLGGTWYTCASA